jgi:hypothetical protein
VATKSGQLCKIKKFTAPEQTSTYIPARKKEEVMQDGKWPKRASESPTALGSALHDAKYLDVTGAEYFDALEKSKGANRDTDGLGTMAVGPFLIGCVDAINGEDGKEVPEFAATRHELKQLAEYWALEGLEHDFEWFVCQQTGSSEWRWSVYIDRRLNAASHPMERRKWDRVFLQSWPIP